jgi:hypothetical protein
MQPWWRVVTGGAVLFAALPVAEVSRPRPTLCSIAPFPTGREAAATYFLGHGLPDTAAASAGNLAPGTSGGHWGSGAPRSVYGQLVAVDTIAGADAGTVEATFARRGRREVVVVPWDYDAGCQPTYWTASARWIPLDRSGFYSLRLRPEAADV